MMVIIDEDAPWLSSMRITDGDDEIGDAEGA